MIYLLRLSEEQLAAHQRRVADARVVRLCVDEETAQERTGGVQATQPKPKRRERRKSRQNASLRQSEAQVLNECKAVLERHPKVAIWWRQNTAAFKIDTRYVKFSFVGASDLMFVSTSGRFGACECKATGRKLTDAQERFLANVNHAGGLGVCVDHSGKLVLALEAL